MLSLRLVAQVCDSIGKEDLNGCIKAAMKESYEYILQSLKTSH